MHICRKVMQIWDSWVLQIIHRHIPAAAGLAGGSSDCAATLLGVNELCELGLTLGELCDIGVSLGADVPFCLQKGTMLSEGIGEILTRLPDLSPLWALLIKPDISVSTGYVYTHLKLDEITDRPDTEHLIDCIRRHVSLKRSTAPTERNANDV